MHELAEGGMERVVRGAPRVNPPRWLRTRMQYGWLLPASRSEAGRSGEPFV